MTIRFAAARSARVRTLSAGACRDASLSAVNDNARREAGRSAKAAGRYPGAAFGDPILTAALHHFARHGLASAERAQAEALAATRDRDGETRRRWLAILGCFDRRRAARLALDCQASARAAGPALV